MTWSVKVAAPGANIPEGHSACLSCKHGQFPRTGPQPCNVARLAYVLGYALTTIDVGADGHMASGTAVLNCDGYEAVDAAPREGGGPS
jgi:hypothetical protein